MQEDFFNWLIDPQSGRGTNRTESEMLFCCIVLDAPMINRAMFVRMWNGSALRICAGGGANTLYAACTDSLKPVPKLPHAIVGPKASIRSGVRQYFQCAAGVSFVDLASDQDNMSVLEKSIKFMESFLRSNPNSKTDLGLAVAGCTDRFWESLGIADSLYKSLKNNTGMPVTHIGKNDITVVLREGFHDMKLPKHCVGQPCIVLPVCGPVSYIKSTGLKYDLPKQGKGLEFGETVSTDNAIREEIITFDTNGPILFTFKD